jgi:hypothetical protein
MRETFKMETKAVKPIRYKSGLLARDWDPISRKYGEMGTHLLLGTRVPRPESRVAIMLMLLVICVFGCARTAGGIRVIPMSNRHVLALSPDDVVEVMRRAGFTDGQILEYGTDLRNGLAESGAVQIKIGRKVEAVFAINLTEGNCVYISTRLRGNLIYNVDSGWVGGGR